MRLKSIDPTTGRKIATYEEFSSSQINQVLENSRLSQLHWRKKSIESRLDYLNEMIGVLNDGRKEFSILMAHEMGKPLSQAEGEIEKCILLCEYYRDNSMQFLKDKIIKHDTHECFVTFQPIGLILGIMPWNFPFWQVFRFAIPTIIAGNSAILKHASNVQGCGFEIENCFKKAGFPDYLFSNISLSGNNTESVIKDSRISAVTITGSTPAGRSVARVAGENLKKTVLELGGSDPYLILDDANIEKAVDACINGRILNAGQSCISAKRIIATEKVYLNVLEALEQKLSEKIMGHPFDEVDIGPMISLASRDEVHDQVLMSIKSGAELLLGGSIPDIDGAFYPITLLADVKPGMVAFDEEIFGPVFSLIMAKDEDHAIDLANNTPFGLGAAIFTENIKKGQDIAKHKIEAGVCFVNDFVKSDPKLPFGGVKESGYGRELGIHGMMEFVNIKTIAIAKD